MNEYLLPNLINTVHIEPTSRCNLLCPQCSRVHGDSLNPDMPLSDLLWETIEPSFTSEFCKSLDHVYFCGNYGDPLASNHFLTILENLHRLGVRKMSIFTNGSLRDPEYFRNLVKLLGPQGKIVFAIDGLEDTNHIYRRGVIWSKVESNLKSFLAAGGNVRWDYLIFEHNAHQVEEARELAGSLGVAEFRAKSTTRFVEPAVARGQRLISPVSIQDRYTKEKNILKPIEESRVFAEKVQKVAEEHGNFDQYILDTDIKCKTQLEKNIYIDFTGRVWPCCWLGSGRYDTVRINPRTQTHDDLDNKYGNGFNQLNKEKTLFDILNHPFFSRDLVQSWSNKGDLKRLWTCGFTCGSKLKINEENKS